MPHSSSSPIASSALAPGSRIGMLGGGQLGMMFAQAAHQLNYTVVVFTPEADCPAAAVADQLVIGHYTNKAALQTFANTVDVITLEFENIPLETLQTLRALCPESTGIFPPHALLEAAQHRLKEKAFLTEHGFEVAPYAAVHNEADLHAGIASLGLPCILKTATLGYDGKGQSVFRTPEDVTDFLSQPGFPAALSERDWILEQFIPYESECSVIAARNHQGQTAHLGVFHNHHINNILDTTITTIASPSDFAQRAIEQTCTLLKASQIVGILCVEFFVMPDGQLIANEMAPRPHNSGHITIDTHTVSQFELHVRAVCGLPLNPESPETPTSSITQSTSGVMLNLMGDLWFANDKTQESIEPNWSLFSDAFTNAQCTLYGKSIAKPARKMGHLNLTTTETLTPAIDTPLVQQLHQVRQQIQEAPRHATR